MGWELHGEQFTLPSGKRPDYVLWNVSTEEFAIIECKDVTNLTATHINQALGYGYETAAENVEVFIASDTEVSYGAQELAKEEDVYIRRLRWRAEPSRERSLHPLVVVAGLAALKDASDAEVAAHQIEVEFISKRRPYFDRDLAHAPVEVDVPLEDGDRYQELTVIHTPGHTPGSIALLDEAHDLLIAGDSMRVLDDGRIAPMEDTYNIDPAQHRDSMRKLTAFTFEAVIVGHGTAMAAGASAEGCRAEALGVVSLLFVIRIPLPS